MGLFVLSYISLSVILLTRHACAGFGKERYPIDFDIAYDPPNHIRIHLSEKHKNGRYFYLKRSTANVYRIGLVTHADTIIFLGNERDMSRFLFLQELEDDRRYLRIVSKSVDRHGNTRRRVDEFIKFPHVNRFLRLFRTPLYMDIPSQETNQLIRVDKDADTGIVRFSVQPEMLIEVTIGVVKFGRYMVNWRTHGLMERNVIWEGGNENPRIKMTSLFNDGSKVDTSYRFDGRGFIMESRSQVPVFQEPCDEGTKGPYDDLQRPEEHRPQKRKVPHDIASSYMASTAPVNLQGGEQGRKRSKKNDGNKSVHEQDGESASTSICEPEDDDSSTESMSLEVSEDEDPSNELENCEISTSGDERDECEDDAEDEGISTVMTPKEPRPTTSCRGRKLRRPKRLYECEDE